jgi:SNF2 family DNA or RNA helicase
MLIFHYFSSFSDFSKKYGSLHTSKQVQKLQKELSPYLLRRMKNDVEKSIPSKEETIVDVELTYTQKTFYRAVLEKNRNFLSMGATVKSNIPSLSNIMMELRKVCNHPYLVAAAEGNL